MSGEGILGEDDVGSDMTAPMARLDRSGSIVVAASPEALYDMVSDVTRMGEWSPVCNACWWDEGDAPRVGAWFTGRNELAGRTWETRVQVVAADRGREFAFVVADHGARWGFTFRRVDAGTDVTESWLFPAESVTALEEQIGAEAANAQMVWRSEQSRREIHDTLAAIKRAAER